MRAKKILSLVLCAVLLIGALLSMGLSVSAAQLTLEDLNAAIANAEALIESRYTADSWAAVQTALTAAKAVADDADQATVDTAAETLNAAISDLVKKPITTVTAEELYNVGFEGIECADQNTYTINNMDITFGWGGASSDIGSDARTGTNALVLTDWGRVSLKVDLLPGETYRLEGYYKNLNVSSSEFRVWLKDRNSAVDGGDKLAGQSMSLRTGMTDYEKFSVTFTVPSNYNGGYLLLKWQNGDDEGVYIDDMSLSILVPADGPNRVALDKAIAEAGTYTDADKYTADSWTALQAALTAAKAVKNNADQAAVDLAAQTLINALNGLTEKPPVTVTPGDVNGDSAVDSKDARLVLQFAVGSAELTAAQQTAADINEDTLIDSKDARLILQTAVGA